MIPDPVCVGLVGSFALVCFTVLVNLLFHVVFTVSFYALSRISCPPCDSQSWAACHKTAEVV